MMGSAGRAIDTPVKATNSSTSLFQLLLLQTHHTELRCARSQLGMYHSHTLHAET